MMRKFQRTWVLVAGLMALMGPLAHAGVGLDLVGSGTYGLLIPPNTGRSSLPGGGLFLNFNLGSKVQFDLGALYMTRAWNDGVTQNSRYAEGQAGFNILLSRALFINLGAYYNYYLNNQVVLSGFDWGFTAGLGLRIPLGKSVGLLIYPQFHKAINALSYNGNSITSTEVAGFLGLSFGMPGSSR